MSYICCRKLHLWVLSDLAATLFITGFVSVGAGDPATPFLHPEICDYQCSTSGCNTSSPHGTSSLQGAGDSSGDSYAQATKMIII
jgi:hypothetical protein